MYKKIEEIKDDKAALEDHLCDNEDADTTNTELFQSATLTFVSSEEEEHWEDNNGDWSKKDKSCKFDDEDEAEDYAGEKYRHFADKPENQGRGDWEYDEEDS
jgi:hypothetical protein